MEQGGQILDDPVNAVVLLLHSGVEAGTLLGCPHDYSVAHALVDFLPFGLVGSILEVMLIAEDDVDVRFFLDSVPPSDLFGDVFFSVLFFRISFGFVPVIGV